MNFLPTTYDAEKKIWSGAKRIPLYNPESSVGKVIFLTMKNWPKNICQISDDDGIVVTYEQALLWATRVAQHLKKRGLNHKDVVGILAKNSTYVMPLAVGCLMNTTPFHAINPGLDLSDTKYIFELTKPKLVFCDGEDYDRIRSATADIKTEIFTLRNHIENVPTIHEFLEPTGTENLYIPQPLVEGGDQTMCILCSSGTTGLPKAVHVSNSTIIQENMQVNSESVTYTASGLGWLTGLWCFMFSVVLGATRIISTELFSPKQFVGLVEKYKISYGLFPAHHVSSLVSSNLATTENMATLKVLSYGGGMLPHTILDTVQKVFKNTMLNNGYGMTEVGAISLNLGMTKTSYSAGKLVPGISARIIDENGKNLGRNETGEICLYHGRKWNGYYGDSVESKNMQDSEGWFHSGDLGYFDENDFLHVIDRKKEILKCNGSHYWPTEIEHVVAEVPGVVDVCVVGIYDDVAGDAPAALVVKQKGSPLTAEDIIQYVANNVATVHKQIRAGVRFVDEIPKNTNGKTMRKKAKELFLSLQS